jgi:hypothetical protein
LPIFIAVNTENFKVKFYNLLGRLVFIDTYQKLDALLSMESVKIVYQIVIIVISEGPRKKHRPVKKD